MNDLNALSLHDLFAELSRDGGLTRLVELARDEDLGHEGRPGDITSLVSIEAGRVGRGEVAMRTEGVLSGLRAVPEIVRVFAPDVAVEFRAQDGDRVQRGAVVAVLEGPLRQILSVERTLLNLLGRMSGIASRVADFVAAVEGTGVRLLDTRKTTPGLRNLEKYAVRCGGGFCHRIGLYDAVLIKDNHLAGVTVEGLPAFVRAAAGKARAVGAEFGGVRFVELEVDTLEQLESVMRAGVCGRERDVGIVLLDNMPLGMLRKAAEMREAHKSDVMLEASGGVTLGTIRAIAQTGVDRISVGGLTHQAVSLDVALDVK